MLADFENSFTVGLSEKFAIKPVSVIAHRTLRMLLHYLVKEFRKSANGW